MEHQLRALRRRIERTSRNARGYRRYDDQLRVEIVEYVLRRRDDGYCQAEVARELGLTQRTIWGWVQQAQHDVVRPVEIIDDHYLTHPAPWAAWWRSAGRLRSCASRCSPPSTSMMSGRFVVCRSRS
jgi:hypothetical protein